MDTIILVILIAIFILVTLLFMRKRKCRCKKEHFSTVASCKRKLEKKFNAFKIDDGPGDFKKFNNYHKNLLNQICDKRPKCLTDNNGYLSCAKFFKKDKFSKEAFKCQRKAIRSKNCEGFKSRFCRFSSGPGYMACATNPNQYFKCDMGNPNNINKECKNLIDSMRDININKVKSYRNFINKFCGTYEKELKVLQPKLESYEYEDAKNICMNHTICFERFRDCKYGDMKCVKKKICQYVKDAKKYGDTNHCADLMKAEKINCD